MKSRILIVVLLLAAAPLYAQRSVDITGWVNWVDPQGDSQFEGDVQTGDFDVDIDTEQGYGGAINIFWSSRVSTEFAAAVIDPAVAARADNPAIPTLALGNLEMIPITATLQFHLSPNGRFDPYIGVGAAYVLFDDIDDAETLGDIGVDRIDFDADVGYLANIGISIDLTSMIAINADAKYVPLSSAATAVFATGPGENFDIEINPLILSAGISIQF